MNLCPDSGEGGERCAECPLWKLEIEERSERGALLDRALHWMDALRLGFCVDLSRVPADEFEAMRIIEEERSMWEKETAQE